MIIGQLLLAMLVVCLILTGIIMLCNKYLD